MNGNFSYITCNYSQSHSHTTRIHLYPIHISLTLLTSFYPFGASNSSSHSVNTPPLFIFCFLPSHLSTNTELHSQSPPKTSHICTSLHKVDYYLPQPQTQSSDIFVLALAGLPKDDSAGREYWHCCASKSESYINHVLPPPLSQYLSSILIHSLNSSIDHKI